MPAETPAGIETSRSSHAASTRLDSLAASVIALVLVAGCLWKDNPNHCPVTNPNPSTDLRGLTERDLDGYLRTSPADIGADELP